MQPALLISGQPRLSSLVIDDVNVYWVNAGPTPTDARNGAVKSVRKAGGGFATQYVGPITDTSPLWLDQGSLYFAQPEGVGTVSVTGGPARAVGGVRKGVQFGVAGGALYWFERDASGSSVRKLTLPDGPQVRLELPDPDKPFDVKAPMVAGPGALYAHDGATLVRIPLDGSPIRRTATTVFRRPESLFAVDADRVYALAPDGIDSQSLSGGDVLRLAAASAPRAIAVDDANVYFSDGSYGSGPGGGPRIAKVSKCGGALSVRASGDIFLPTSLAVDAANLFCVGSNVVIARLAK